MKCRHCGEELRLPFLDLGTAPPSNAYLSRDMLSKAEVWFPLRLLVCESCWLVQTEDFLGRESLFDGDYAYFSSTSTSWLAHCQAYLAEMTERFNLDGSSLLVEVAANDGYLLQYALRAGIRCYGIEPTASTASAARAKGIEVIERFFGEPLAVELAGQGKQGDLVIANNVLAHVPDINDFVRGVAALLKPQGVATFEFPHLLSLVRGCQFDTVYHEHYSYLSLATVRRIFRHAGLEIIDVEQIPTHGGSLRVFAQRSDTGVRAIEKSVDALVAVEAASGMASAAFYEGFQAVAERVKNDFLSFLIAARNEEKHVVAYGAAAKGNTLLNFAGVKSDLIGYVVDRAASKQGKYLPGSRIPIVSEDRLALDKPDYIVILPWNIRDELARQLAYRKTWGAQIVTAIPELTISP